MTDVRDYSAEDLAALFGVSIYTARRVSTGRYKVGASVRFRKEDIDFCRKTGREIEMQK